MIVIIGDSFCADFHHPGLSRPKFDNQTWWLRSDQASWVSDVIKHYNGNVEVYGFGGLPNTNGRNWPNLPWASS